MSKTPVHIYDNSQVVLADCMKYMRKFEDGFFDLAIVDPPYFSGPERRGYYGNAVSPIGVKRVDYLITPEWDVPGKKYFKERSSGTSATAKAPSPTARLPQRTLATASASSPSCGTE